MSAQFAITLLCGVCLVATCMAAGPISSYSLPTFKATVINNGLSAKVWSDASKKIVRIDMEIPGVYPNPDKVTHATQFYSKDKYLAMTWDHGNSSSFYCAYEMTDLSYVFNDVMFGPSYQGLQALNNTIGYAYYLTMYNVFPGTLVIDSFTMYPALFIARPPLNSTYTFVDAAPLSQEESDQMLQVPPKNISCKEVKPGFK